MYSRFFRSVASAQAYGYYFYSELCEFQVKVPYGPKKLSEYPMLSELDLDTVIW